MSLFLSLFVREAVTPGTHEDDKQFCWRSSAAGVWSARQVLLDSTQTADMDEGPRKHEHALNGQALMSSSQCLLIPTSGAT